MAYVTDHPGCLVGVRFFRSVSSTVDFHTCVSACVRVSRACVCRFQVADWLRRRDVCRPMVNEFDCVPNGRRCQSANEAAAWETTLRRNEITPLRFLPRRLRVCPIFWKEPSPSSPPASPYSFPPLLATLACLFLTLSTSLSLSLTPTAFVPLPPSHPPPQARSNHTHSLLCFCRACASAPGPPRVGTRG